MYYMQESYRPLREIPTEDMLEAVKISMNYEADLYFFQHLVVSWIGLPMEQNIERLGEYGIETYVVDNCCRFRYKDPAKNVKKLYYTVYELEKGRGEIHLKSMPAYLGHKHYSSKDEIYNQIRRDYPSIRFITVVDFSGEKFTGSYEYELYGGE